MISGAEILELYNHRKRNRGRWEQDAQKIRQTYNFELVVPLPELDKAETPGIANLVAIGVDQTAMRIASQMPDIAFPPLRPGIGRSEDLARQRRLATLAWWDMNAMQMILRQRARFLIGYGHSPVVIMPVSPKVSDKRKIPFWRTFNPLDSYLPHPQFLGDMEPEDGIFCHHQSFVWLDARYSDAMRRIQKGPENAPDSKYEVLHYLDAEESVTMVIGSQYETVKTGWGMKDVPRGTPYEILDRAPNRSGICPVVNPSRISLDRTQGMFTALPSMYQKQAKLDALEYIGIHRGVFPEQWAVTHPTSPSAVRVVVPADSTTGTIGEIQGGQIQMVPVNPGVQTPQAIDRLERNQRVTAGIPAEYGGESPTNIRTARRGAAVLSSTVDMPIGEAQDIFARSLEAEDVRAIAMMKGCYGSRSTSFYLPRNGKVTRKDYTPDDAFETDWHVVKYSIPGADAAAIPIELGQRTGTGEMSLQTAREIDPIIEDPIRERNQVELEGLRHALLSGLEQQAGAGTFDPMMIAYIAQAKADDEGLQLEDAVVKVHKKQQAAQAQQQSQQQPPDQAAPDQSQMPGINQPPPQQSDQGPPQPPGQMIGPPPGSSQHLEQILQTLRRGSRQSPQEAQLAG